MSASIYDPATKTLVPFAGTSISMMSELSDVELSAPSNGQVLRYDSSNQAWENADNVSDVSVTPVLSSGTKIATVTVDGSSTDLYAPSGGGSTGGGHTIEDSEGTDLTQRDILQFGEGFKAEDDDTNEKTVISPNVMQSGDMSDIVTPLPSVAPKKEGIKYSTTEQVVGEWIDGKPLYQKTVTGTVPNGWGDTAHNVANIDLVVDVTCGIIHSNSYIIIGGATDAGRFLCQVGRTNVALYVAPSSYEGDDFICTFKYTKTTDTPNT